MASYGQYCPITRALDMIGDRWTLLIIRDLLLGVRRFNDLARGLPRLSRGLLSKRLDQLEKAGIVERRDGGYVPTAAGEGLRPLVMGLAEWGARWSFGEPREDELDPETLLWWIRGGIDPAPFDRPRVVLHVLLPGTGRSRYWLVVERADVSLCFTDPGFDVDITIESSLDTLYQVWLGRIELVAAMRDGLVRVHGPRPLVQALPAALRLSPVAPIVQALVAAGAPG